MKRRLIYRNEAVAELAEAKAYTLRTWGSAQARSYTAALVADIKALRASALRYPLYDHVYPNLRRKRSGMHHIYFLAFEDRVEIVRIMHVQRDPGLHLRNESEPREANDEG
jgi:plasmid stabilization system protein ParE